MLRFLPILTVCFGLLACKDAQTGDFVGTWVVTGESRHRFLSTEQQKAAATIVLAANGTFVATEVPEDLLYGPPQAGNGIVTGNGDWKLLSREDRQQIQLNFEKIAAGQRSVLPYGTQLNVSKGWSVVTLFYFQGDADQGRRIEFEKK